MKGTDVPLVKEVIRQFIRDNLEIRMTLSKSFYTNVLLVDVLLDGESVAQDKVKFDLPKRR